MSYGATGSNGVTAVCSPAKAETARALSADTVADYTRKDFTCSGKTLRPDARHSREPHLVTVQRRTRTDCHPGRGPGLGKHCVGRNRTLMHFVGVRLASIRGPAEKWLRSSRSSTRRICWSAEGTRGGTVTQLWTDATISTRCPQPSPTWVKGMPKVRSWCGHEESSQSAYRRHCGKLHAVRIPLPRAYPPVYAAVISAVISASRSRRGVKSITSPFSTCSASKNTAKGGLTAHRWLTA